MYASSLSSPSMLFRLLLLNALVIFGVPAGERVTQSKPHLNESSEASISNQLNHGVSHQSLTADALTTDYSKIGRNVGNDVELFGEGPIPVILRETNIAFQVCDSCSGTTKVCYASNQVEPSAAEGCYGLVSNCRFEVNVHRKQYSFMGVANIHVDFPQQCPSFAMRFSNVTLEKGFSFSSCNPDYDQDKKIMLYSFATSSCRITIPNAYIPDPPTTISPPLSHKTSDAAESANFFETTGGTVVIILFVVLIVGVFVGVILCLLCKKTKLFQSKAKEVNVESIQVDQPEYTAVEDSKKSKAEVPKKKQQNMNIEKKSMVEKKIKHAEVPKKTEANAPKKDMKAMEMVKKASEEPAKIADEPKMKSDPTQEPTKTEDGPPPPAIDEDAGAEDDTPPLPPPPPAVVVVEQAPSKPKNRAENAPQSKRHRRRHAKRAPPTFEAPPLESVIEKPRRPTAQTLPRRKRTPSPVDSQELERRRMIRSGQAVKPRPGENIRKYLPKNY